VEREGDQLLRPPRLQLRRLRRAARAQTFAENISKVLYPEDSTPQGKELRLQQQYFFVAASIGDFLEHLPEDFDITKLPERIIFQLNDTHPVIGVPELMRVLVDERGLEWDAAWAITQQCFAYTCHTLLPEALEVWSVDLLGRLLPRHLEIIYRINEEFLAEVRERFGDDEMRIRNMSIIGEFPSARPHGVPRDRRRCEGQRRRRAALAAAARQGAAGLQRVLPGQVHERHERRHAAPLRAAREPGPVRAHHRGDRHRLGHRPRALRELEAYAEDPQFREAFAAVKAANKRRLGDVLRARDGIEISDGTCSTSWSSVCTSTSGRC
jgi:starch phosphorylase